MPEKKDIKAIYRNAILLIKDINSQFEKDPEVKIPDSTLDTLKDYFTDIIDFEKMYLISVEDKFYGILLMNIDIRIDFTQQGPLDLGVSSEPFALIINPLWCVDYSFQELTGLIIAELLKIVYAHPSSYLEINSEKDNNKHSFLEKASAASMSEIVKHDIRLNGDTYGLRLPHDAYTRENLNSEITVQAGTNQSLEYYYKVLNKFSKKEKQNSGSEEQPPCTSSCSCGNQQNKNKVSSPDGSSNDGHPVHDWESELAKQTSDDVTERIKCFVSSSMDAYNAISDRSKGDLPGSILEQIKKLLAPPEINWKQVLRKLLGAVPVPYRKTKTRLNRRQPYRADLSGRLPKRTVDVVVAIDTSGSMSDRDIAYCMNEIFNITKDYEGTKITVIECDASIGKVYQARRMSDIQTKVSGRGGTSFIPVIDFINGEGQYASNPLSGKFQKALLVYFTDGYGDYEIPKPKTYRNLWVVLGDEQNLSLREPYGEVKSLKGDKDWQKLNM